MSRGYYYKCTDCGREASYAGKSTEEIADDAAAYNEIECPEGSEKVCNFELFKVEQ